MPELTVKEEQFIKQLMANTSIVTHGRTLTFVDYSVGYSISEEGVRLDMSDDDAHYYFDIYDRSEHLYINFKDKSITCRKGYDQIYIEWFDGIDDFIIGDDITVRGMLPPQEFDTITFNGITLTKSDVEQLLEQFKIPLWKIELRKNMYYLINTRTLPVKQVVIWDITEPLQFNLGRVIFSIADALGYLASGSKIVGQFNEKYTIEFALDAQQFVYRSRDLLVATGALIDTEEHAQEIVKLLNASTIPSQFNLEPLGDE